MSIGVVMADDHDIVLRGLESVLGTEPDIHILAQCRNGDEAWQAIRRHRPDVAVLDLRMPGSDGLEVLRRVKQEQTPTRVVFLVAALDREELLEALRLGVAGVVPLRAAHWQQQRALVPVLAHCARTAVAKWRTLADAVMTGSNFSTRAPPILSCAWTCSESTSSDRWCLLKHFNSFYFLKFHDLS